MAPVDSCIKGFLIKKVPCNTSLCPIYPPGLHFTKLITSFPRTILQDRGTRSQETNYHR